MSAPAIVSAVVIGVVLWMGARPMLRGREARSRRRPF